MYHAPATVSPVSRKTYGAFLNVEGAVGRGRERGAKAVPDYSIRKRRRNVHAKSTSLNPFANGYGYEPQWPMAAPPAAAISSGIQVSERSGCTPRLPQGAGAAAPRMPTTHVA